MRTRLYGVLSIAIALHWIAAGLSIHPLARMPEEPQRLTGAAWFGVRRAATAYMNAVSFPQAWRMFSGANPRVTRYLSAQVTFADGATQTHEFPRFGVMPYWKSQRWNRHFLMHRTISSNAALQPDLARWLARRYNRNSSSPVEVTIVATIVVVPPPADAGEDDGVGWVDYTRLLRHEPAVERDTLITYRVLPGDLR